MRSHRGFSLLELLVTLSLALILAAMGIPLVQESSVRNTVWTATETIGIQVRQARLKAISKNRSYRIRFDCPAVGQMRVLRVTGTTAIDNAANRCSLYQDDDSGIYAMPPQVTYTTGLPVLEVSGRGTYTAIGGSVPLTINVGYGGRTFRSMTVSATGQISFATY